MPHGRDRFSGIGETSSSPPTVAGSANQSSPYYADKTESLKAIFGARDVVLESDHIVIDGIARPLIDDVIICLDQITWPPSLRTRLGIKQGEPEPQDPAARIQYTFGEEWKQFSNVLPDHERVFRQYFDLVNLDLLRNDRLCDLGCGMGRWSYFASLHCREIVLVDFSEAIFVAREVMRQRSNAIFVMADVQRLPFAPDFADLLFSLGVLHHLPTPALNHVVALRRYAKQLLIYLYYALDNRPAYFRTLLSLVTPMRRSLARLRHKRLRYLIASVIAAGMYLPLIGLGSLLKRSGRKTIVPLYEAYHDKSFTGIAQDAYDRFFTPIEQRVTRVQIEELSKHFRRVVVSDHFPYWHFVCVR